MSVIGLMAFIVLGLLGIFLPTIILTETKNHFISKAKSTVYESTSDKNKLTPVQEKLVEMATTDALAVIDVTNPDKANKQIDVVERLRRIN